MKIRSGTIGKGTLPVLAAAFLCTGTQAQIIPGGYTCSASFTRTNNMSLDIALTNATCILPVEMAHWFDLSADLDFAGSYVTLKCVDFSMWGTTNIADQLISVRVFQDLTPSSSDDGCDSQISGYDGTNEPGPDLASALLLGEDETFIPIGVNPPGVPRPDGDFSVEFTGTQGGGILLSPDIAFFVVIGHAGEANTQFGANASGEIGDSTTGAPGGFTGGPEQTWVRPFNCTVGGSVCSQTGDWMKAALYYTALDFVMVLHMDLNDTRDPPPLAFDCRQDIAPVDVEVDPETGDIISVTIVGDKQVNVSDLLILLGSWGQLAPPRPLGDIAPCPAPGVDCFGDNQVNVTDLLALLGAWGPCPNLVKDCSTALDPGNITAQISEGTFAWSIEVGLLETTVARPSTDELSAILAVGVGICGWANYTQSGGLITGAPDSLGTADGFIWGDAFGIFSGNLNDGPGGPTTPDPAVVGGDVWFQYTAACNGRVFISATSNCGVDEVVDTILEVYPGDVCPAGWTDVLLCDDDSLDPAGCGNFGEVDFLVVQGEEFLIRIAGWLGETGSGDLNITCVDNSQCSAALEITAPFVGSPNSGSTIGAGLSGPPNCPISQDGGGRWYSVIGDGNTLTASTCLTAEVEDAAGTGEFYDSQISIYCGTLGEVCADLTCVASSDGSGTCNLHDTVSWCTTFGQEYYILVHGDGGLTGPTFFGEGFFILDVTSDGASCATALTCGVARPFNDKCADAFVLVPGPYIETSTGSGIFVSTVNTPTIPDTPPRHNNINALTDGPPPNPGCTFINQDVWYSYAPDFTSSVVVDTCFFLDSPVNVDTAIEIYIADSAACPPINSDGFIECQNGSPSCPGGSQFTTPVIIFADQEILIRLGSNGGDKEGFFTLRVAATALVSLCPDPLEWDPCPEDGVREGGGDGELLLASPPYTTLDITVIAGDGTFAAGDTVEGLTSGETGVIIALQNIGGVDILMLDNVSGLFSAGETVTNGDPENPDILTDANATAVVVSDFTESIDITNGGCNMCEPGQLFEALTPGTVLDVEPSAPGSLICGQISTYVSDADLDCESGLDGVMYELRDTDWYTISVPEINDPDGIPTQGGTVNITFSSEFPASFGITEAVCGATPGNVVPFIGSSINGGLCSESLLSVTLPAGDYFVVVTAFNLTGIEVGGTHEGHDYLLNIAPIAAGTPFPVINDECEDAILVTSNSTFLADQRTDATENSDDPNGCISATRHFGSVWYKFVATHDTASVITCNTFSDTAAGFFDSSLLVFSGTCAALTVVGCSEDACGPAFCPCLSAVGLADLIVSSTYYISVGAWSSGDKGVYKVEITSP